MDILARIDRQARLIRGPAGELKVEESYRGFERLVQLVIQALLDLGLMAMSAIGGRSPRSYSEVGYVLSEHGIVDKPDAELLRSMTSFRNILAHSYAIVDKEKVC